ncbi:hypothetical protein AKJ58_00505 [candidate division MSBL1 archaeon SCGC-AAA385D11]|uniref:SpoVT-AbrB domain-containing protein n=1 Tax=candidate division MSBL1 archaeon SCGC-AAA385D11 TaxID=1698286 RepID=A0A133VP95_9EURY|nr:hypothetical protein AKJ58_00505 [candidate division MSBL1 archaeon SCGC-AAA385D11]
MVESIVKIGKRGQITLPKEIREKEGLKEGSFLEISDIGGVLTLRKIEKKPSALDLFKEVGEALKKEGYTRETILELVKEPRKAS